MRKPLYLPDDVKARMIDAALESATTPAAHVWQMVKHALDLTLGSPELESALIRRALELQGIAPRKGMGK